MAFVNEYISGEDKEKLQNNVKLSNSFANYGSSEIKIFSIKTIDHWTIDREEDIFFRECGDELEYVSDVSRNLASGVKIFLLHLSCSIYFVHLKYLYKISSKNRDADPFQAFWQLSTMHHASGVKLNEADIIQTLKSAMDVFVVFGVKRNYKNPIVELLNIKGEVL